MCEGETPTPSKSTTVLYSVYDMITWYTYYISRNGKHNFNRD
jgi:hypothetical protein